MHRMEQRNDADYAREHRWPDALCSTSGVSGTPLMPFAQPREDFLAGGTPSYMRRP
jgi:hypothetical protein